ncbi:MAG: response regulator transcription factor [Verrucomicrobia bacterium]|nr:response regulator transcription factor [Verrucomicrobiota bacterium]
MTPDHFPTSSIPPRILVVEDDARLADLVVEYLQEHGGYRVTASGDGRDGLRSILADPPNLVILDIMLPGMDGMDVCRQARAAGFKGAVLMLTARGDEVDEVLGLEIGADDYVAKPARPRALLARVKALLRRSPESIPSEQTISVAGLEMDSGNRTTQLNGQTVDLTTAEFDLLWYLARQAGRVVDRDEIFEGVKGIEYDGIDRSIDLRIARLRKKLGDDAKHPQRIKSIRGTGYLMVTQMNSAEESA